MSEEQEPTTSNTTSVSKSRSYIKPLICVVCVLAIAGAGISFVSKSSNSNKGGKLWQEEETIEVKSGTLENLMQELQEETHNGSASGDEALKTPKVTSLRQVNSAIEVNWKKVKGAKGYAVFRTTDGETWDEIAHVRGTDHSYTDTTAEPGNTYYYSLVAATTEQSMANSESSPAEMCFYLENPMVSVSKKGAKAVASWEKVDKATGYVLEYANNSLFVGAKSESIDDGSTTEFTISDLNKKDSCYVRIRATGDYTENVEAADYEWSYTENVGTTKKAHLEQLKTKDGKPFKMRSAAKQKVDGYRQVQGSTTDGKNMYYALFNREKNKSKLVKVRLKDMKVLKVSDALPIYHANDITYNSGANAIIVAHNAGDGRGLTAVDADSFEVITTAKLAKDASGLVGSGISNVNKVDSIASLAYCEEANAYVAAVSSKHDLLQLDENANTTRIIPCKSKSTGTYQNIEINNGLIIVSTSKGGEQETNYLWSYTWTGDLINKICVGSNYEIESVFVCGDDLYACFYAIEGNEREGYCYKLSNY